MLLEPKTIEIQLSNGQKRNYIISKFPAMAGIEIVSNFPFSALPKIGEWSKCEAMILKIMSYVEYETVPGIKLPLTTIELINNHVPSWEDLSKLLIKMFEYNCSFFQNGLFQTLGQRITQDLPQWIVKIFTQCLQQLSTLEKETSDS